MSLRTLTKKLSLNKGPNVALLENDRHQWNKERSHLCQSRFQSNNSTDYVELLPPRPSALQIGAPIALPNMCVVRFSSHPRQHYVGRIPLALDSYAYLFLQPFSGTKALPPIHFHNSTGFEEAISVYQDSCANRMWSSMALMDLEFVPPSVDNIFIGIHLPQNFFNPSASKLASQQKYAASGIIELLDIEEVDDDQWRRSDLKWPAWELTSERAEKAEQDMFKQQPELFDTNALYSTYICEKETGYLKNYVWCRMYRVEGGSWEFQAIREPVTTPNLRGCVPSMRKLLNTRGILLKSLDGRVLHIHSSDPLSTLSLRCLSYDRLGFQVGEAHLVEHHKRGELQLQLDWSSPLIHKNVTTIFLVWEGESDSPLELQIDDFSVLQFPGRSHSILGRITCLTDSTSIYPTPKRDKWTFFFEPAALGEEGLDIIEEIQPKPSHLVVVVQHGRDLAASSARVAITLGRTTEKTPSSSIDYIWNHTATWPLESTWERGHREVHFNVYSRSLTGKTTLGSAVFELDQMRLPFCGELRLRPALNSSAKKVGGYIFVVIEAALSEATEKAEK